MTSILAIFQLAALGAWGCVTGVVLLRGEALVR